MSQEKLVFLFLLFPSENTVEKRLGWISKVIINFSLPSSPLFLPPSSPLYFPQKIETAVCLPRIYFPLPFLFPPEKRVKAGGLILRFPFVHFVTTFSTISSSRCLPLKRRRSRIMPLGTTCHQSETIFRCRVLCTPTQKEDGKKKREK